nr:carboxypeptidase regulatory-like domain-containing protein [Pyrinomonadaceae bacterium]
MSQTLRAVALLLLVQALCTGQSTTQSIQGLVTDSTGAVAAGARVTATEVNTGVVRNVTTNESGNFTVPLIPVGNYDLRVELQGFKSELVS